MGLIEGLIYFVLTLLVYSGVLYFAMRLTRVEGTFAAIFTISLIVAIVNLLPGFGWILGLVVLLWLLTKWTSAEFWPDACLMVLVAALIRYVIAFAITQLIYSGQG